MTSEPSGRLYSAVTKYWPRIAAGLVAVIGLGELVVGGVTADSGLESYLIAWGATTGALWFLADRGEAALSEEGRALVGGWLTSKDLRSNVESIPKHFVILFDHIFGKRHFGWSCFARSALASTIAAIGVFGLTLTTDLWRTVPTAPYTLVGSVLFLLPMWFAYVKVRRQSGRVKAIGSALLMAVAVPLVTLALLVTSQRVPFLRLDEPGLLWSGLVSALGAFFALAFLNFGPDYLSLLETRLLLGWMARSRRWLGILVVDVLATWTIWAGWIVLFLLLLTWGAKATVLDAQSDVPSTSAIVALLWPPNFVEELFLRPRPESGFANFATMRLFFFTTFLTSVWLWVYAVSVLVSRVLVRMNNGVGFLLRVTDVEKQPFRSMGFVSVIIVSGLFALGLPLVLL